MTDTAANQPVVEPQIDETTPPPPEPWTPQRVSEWNAYYDVYVAAFVLALAFLGFANRIQPSNSALWSQLETGREISAAGSPLGINGGTVAAEGRRWVDIPWLFDVIHYQVYQRVAAIGSAPDPSAPQPIKAATNRGDQWGAGALVALGALVRVLTAWLLLGLRRKGPGLWWTALCVVAALGVTLSPEPVETIGPATTGGGEVVHVVVPAIGIQLGGIAVLASSVTPEVWGTMLLALELLLLHQAFNLGKTSRLYGLIPLFLVWANLDEMFGFGLLVLLAAAIGRIVDTQGARDLVGPSARTTLIVLAASSAAVLVNPSHIFGMLAGFGILFRSVGLDIGPPSIRIGSMFGSDFLKNFGAAFARSFQIYYAVLVLIGLGSFALNYQRFSLSRFLMFAVASLIWAFSMVYAAPFGLVFAAVLALNGQEWYHATIGTEGRLGGGWVFWSTGGRLLTIALVFAAIFRATTGWGGQVGDSRFGFGFDPDDFPFESAAAVAAAPLEGNILNTTYAQGDVLGWLAAGKRKPYIDSKSHLYPIAVREEFENLRKAIRDDKVEVWRPILDAAKISAVMIQTAGAPLTYTRLMNSPNWAPFYDDGAVAMFGRTDSSAVAADVAYFKANQLNAQELAFKRPKLTAPWFDKPRVVSELVDSIFANRLLNRTQPHVEAARHWLRPATIPAGTTYLPDPAHCLLAIRELREALSSKPNDYAAYLMLTEAYRLLLAQESALIAGVKLSEASLTAVAQSQLQPRLLAVRFHQLLTAANFALQTLPPAKTAADRAERAQLNFSLASLYLQSGDLDLARERRIAIDPREGEFPDDFFKSQLQILNDLNTRLDQVQTQLDAMTAQQRSSPLAKANYARSAGAPGMAIRELEEAEGAGGGQPGVRPTLVDLYCDTGQPEKALDIISLLNIDDPSLSSGAGTVGTATHRQGMVYFLLGDYRNAISLWADRSIGQVLNQRLFQAPMATKSLLQGEPVAATRMFVELPEKIDQQAQYEFELGMAALEGGAESSYVAEHLRSALVLEPNLNVRPVIAYYLEQLGEAVPPPRLAVPPVASVLSGPRPATPAAPTEPTPSPAPTTPPATELPVNPIEPPKP